MELAERGMDQLFVATMTGHSVRLVQGRGRHARAVPALIEPADKRAR